MYTGVIAFIFLIISSLIYLAVSLTKHSERIDDLEEDVKAAIYEDLMKKSVPGVGKTEEEEAEDRISGLEKLAGSAKTQSIENYVRINRNEDNDKDFKKEYCKTVKVINRTIDFLSNTHVDAVKDTVKDTAKKNESFSGYCPVIRKYNKVDDPYRYINQRFGSRIVRKIFKGKRGGPIALCECACGEMRDIRLGKLIRGERRACKSCCNSSEEIFQGKIFGKRTVIDGPHAKVIKCGKTVKQYTVKCACGDISVVDAGSLRRKNGSSEVCKACCYIYRDSKRV